MSRRSGGRQARLAERLAPLTEEAKPVHPGETGQTEGIHRFTAKM